MIQPKARSHLRRASGYNGPIYQPDPLGISPLTANLTANEWISIRQPGHYRITVETKRAAPAHTRSELEMPVTLRSNAIEIDAVAPEPGWADALIKRASNVISGAAPNQIRFDDNDAARALRFLGTRDAAEALVRFHLNGPPGVQYELLQGLRESPFREEIIAELEAALADPDAKISGQARTTLNMLTSGVLP